MKKIIIILSFLVLYNNIFSYQDSTSAISEFSARLKKGNIYLRWLIKSLPQISKIRIEVKSSEESIYQLIDEINIENYTKKIKQDSLDYLQYNYTYKPLKNGVYFFKINLIDKNYIIEYSDAIKIGVSDVIEFKLYQNSPNPFNPSTYISYELYSAMKIVLKIYSLDGKEIETLVDEFQNPGSYRIEFSAMKYAELSSGIYFYKLQTDHSSDIKKMIFTK
ncbi:MAG: T9SS type A sorting domain-containing protein [Ignavibacteria bacterium]